MSLTSNELNSTSPVKEYFAHLLLCDLWLAHAYLRSCRVWRGRTYSSRFEGWLHLLVLQFLPVHVAEEAVLSDVSLPLWTTAQAFRWMLCHQLCRHGEEKRLLCVHLAFFLFVFFKWMLIHLSTFLVVLTLQKKLVATLASLWGCIFMHLCCEVNLTFTILTYWCLANMMFTTLTVIVSENSAL